MEIISVSHYFGKDVYKFSNGTKVTMNKGTGSVQVDKNDTIIVQGGENVSVQGTKGDDKIVLENSHVKSVFLSEGKNKLFCNGCQFNDFNMWGHGGTYISGGYSSKKKHSSEIVIKGDFRGTINAQQGLGAGYGDMMARKDNIIITGNNEGEIKVDTHDIVSVNGDNNGRVFNQTIM